MKNLLPLSAQIKKLINGWERVLLLSDFDGTLSPIAPTPEQAEILPEIRTILAEMIGNPKFQIGIISGRSLADLKNKIKLEGLIYAGNHGLEIEGPKLKYINPQAKKIEPALKIIKQKLDKKITDYPGALVENKGLSIGIHYRQLEQGKEQEFKNMIESIVRELSKTDLLKISGGKKVFEVRPAIEWNKGSAIKLMIEHYKDRYLPVFLGDDLTDEDGFKAIKEYGQGTSIIVGKMKADSAAEYRLKNTLEVTTFLKMLSAK